MSCIWNQSLVLWYSKRRVFHSHLVLQFRSTMPSPLLFVHHHSWHHSCLHCLSVTPRTFRRLFLLLHSPSHSVVHFGCCCYWLDCYLQCCWLAQYCHFFYYWCYKNDKGKIKFLKDFDLDCLYYLPVHWRWSWEHLILLHSLECLLLPVIHFFLHFVEILMLEDPFLDDSWLEVIRMLYTPFFVLMIIVWLSAHIDKLDYGKLAEGHWYILWH